MYLVIFLFSFFVIFNNASCTNFRVTADNNQVASSNMIEESNKESDLITLSAEQPKRNDSLLDIQYGIRQMDDIVLQEKPVFLNTIPHTTLNQLLFVNSSGLFTNITVLLTTTIPIATVSPENDSIHRILSVSESSDLLDGMKADVNKIAKKISTSLESLPTEILKVIQDAGDFIKKITALLTGDKLNENFLGNSTSNSTLNHSKVEKLH